MTDVERSLPVLDDERLTAMEDRVFARIGADRARRARVRRRWSIGGSAVAILVVLAAAVTPAVVSSLRPALPAFPAIESVPVPGQGSMDGATLTSPNELDRAVTSSASASVTVEDTRRAAESIGADARARGGYVESVTFTSDSPGRPSDSSPSASEPMILPTVPIGDSTTVRVPAGDLADVITTLSSLGDVTASRVDHQDVTAVRAELDARIAAQEASLARLTELMSSATSTADLIAAESALAERQTALDIDRQQRAREESAIALASVTVQLTPRSAAVTADPAGFSDGVAAGWNGIVAALNGLTVGIGFLLPWLVIAAGAAAIVGVVRLVRRRVRARRGASRPE